jgi:cupin fold WbuC family metalloprotein
MKIISEKLLNKVSNEAKESSRNRINYNFHTDYADVCQRMLNALEPETYIHPHRHANPDKDEVFIVLRGSLLVVEFDDNGLITDYTILDASKGIHGVEIRPRTFHTIISLCPGTVIFEVKQGPYDKTDDKNFAKWAPAEGSTGMKDYNNNILKQLGVFY